MIDRDETLASWRDDRSFGWLLLLPPLRGLDILCPAGDEPLARALTMAGAHVVLLREVGMAPSEARPLPGMCTATQHELAELRQRHGPQAIAFDGVVFHDPAAHRLNSETLADFMRQMSKILPLMRDESFMYVGLRNAWSPASRGLRPAAARTRDLVGVLRTVGLVRRARHPYMLQNTRVCEVLPPSGYACTKNRELPRERLKEYVLGRIGSRLIAPAYGLVFSRGFAPRSVLERILEQLSTRRRIGIVLKSFLVFAGHKAILAVGPEGSSKDDLIVIVAEDAMTRQRRRAESEHLDSLARLPSAIASRVPRRIDEFDVHGAHCVIMTRVPGHTLDVESASLEPLTDAALTFLVDLNLSSIRWIEVTPECYARMFETLLSDACQRNPWATKSLRTLEGAVRRIVIGQRVPVVWFHGDYKVENVMYETGPVRLSGVIDWEHANPEGLPLLDLLYLLVYNRGIRGQAWVDAARSLLLEAPSSIELERLARYVAHVPLDSALRAALGAMFVAHHIGRRLFLGDDETLQARVLSLLEDLAAQLAQRAQRGHCRAPTNAHGRNEAGMAAPRNSQTY